MEFECLMLFATHPNIALTREFMIGQLWGGNFSGETRTIDVHVMRLRQKLGFADVIKTISRVGYRLEVERITLTYMRIEEAGTGKYLLVPVWDFCGKEWNEEPVEYYMGGAAEASWAE